MKKIQVYSFVNNPLSIATSGDSYKPNSLVEYPNDVKGDDEKMIEYGNEMISMWTLEVQGLQEKKESNETEIPKDKEIDRRQTFRIADKLKATLKKETNNINNTKTNKEWTENNQTGMIRPALLSKGFSFNKTAAVKLFGDKYSVKPNLILFFILGSLFMG